MVALALYSKCITVAEATLELINANFYDEAFGMTRTLIDIYITLRYISNHDTEERARLFYQFFTKNSEGWSEVIKTFWPHQYQPLDERTKNIAKNYPSPHKWSGKQVKEMALEPDNFDIDPNTGLPLILDFDYKVVYRWSSHFVHPTIGCLDNHIVQAGRDNFIIHSGNDLDMKSTSVFNIASYVAKTMISFYRCMGELPPSRVNIWSNAIIKHLANYHSAK